MARFELNHQRLAELRALHPELATDHALAQHIGINHGHLSRILRGKNTPGAKFAPNLLAAFGITQIGDGLFTIIEDDAA